MYDAHVMLKTHDNYPYEPLVRGILNTGDRIIQSSSSHSITDNSIVVTWNNYGVPERQARRCRELGGKHVAMENGYVGRGKGYYLMNQDGFGGSEKVKFRNCSPDRWNKLDTRLNPWDKKGRYILVCAQRGKGYNSQAMSDDWPDQIIAKIRKLTDRPILFRPHPMKVNYPKNQEDVTIINSKLESMEQTLERGVFATVVWTSNSATQSLIRGIPVFYCGPVLACDTIASKDINNLENPFYPDREQAFFDLAWRQWNLNEIQDGTAWRAVTR